MFDINLLSEGRDQPAGRTRGRTGTRQSYPSMREWRELFLDRWIVGSGLVFLASLAIGVHAVVGVSRRVADLDSALAEALRDSARIAAQALIRREMDTKHDSITARLTLIEEADARRYAWPHLLQEVAVATPDGVWITGMADVPSQGPQIRFRLEGNARDNVTLTRFWTALEASFFIGEVELIATEQPVAQDPARESDWAHAYRFVFEANMQDPPYEVLDFRPLTDEGP